ncbi:MAG: ABC transporter permease [Actinomycetales bacterium]|nr:ABC transporter permease [Candidatus Phosphoribacter baldrii]MBK6956251.1 ABC transporter permease [Candidatus Phosphoribacter baldrii]
MLIYIARRAIMAVSVILVVLVATFLLFFAGPADPAQSMCGETRCTTQRLEDIRRSLGTDRPVAIQFKEYFQGLLVGRDIYVSGSPKHCEAPCLGFSFRTGVEVKDALATRFPNTAMLALMSMVIFLSVGVSTGVLAARRRGSGLDRGIVGFSQVFGSIPSYITGLLFALNFTVLYPLLPRYANRSDGIAGWIAGLVAPAIILGLFYATGYVRYARASMVDTLNQDYVRTARSKGISEQTVVYKHGLRAALSPVVTILGLDMAGLLSGTLITEQIFGVDGIGRFAIESLRNDDLPIIMGTVLIGCVLVVIMNLIVDIAYSFLDPRVRLS